MLRNALPPQFRIPEIIGPPQIPDADSEAAYVGLYTMLITLISVHGGVLSEGKMDRFLKRMNTDAYTPIGNTDDVLKRMIKDGYIVKVKDTSSGEEIVDYHVGPRGKVEVGDDTVANMVRTVYSVGDPVEDLEERLNRSLGVVPGEANGATQREEAGAAVTQDGEQQRRPGRPRRRREDSEDE